mgnify:CR=1 FL=1
MILIISLLILMGILLYFAYKNERCGKLEYIAIIGLTIFFYIIGSAMINEIFGTYKPVSGETKNIISLRNNNEVSGSFILGSGRIDEKEYYYTFIKINNDKYKRKKYPVEKSVIYETSQNSQKVVEKRKTIDDPLIIGCISEEKYILRVPKGTIVKEFKVQ